MQITLESLCPGNSQHFSDEESDCIAGDTGDVGDTSWIPGLGRLPREGNGHALQYSCLGNPMDRAVCWATVQGSQRVRHDWMTEQTHTRYAQRQKALGRLEWLWWCPAPFRFAVTRWSHQRTELLGASKNSVYWLEIRELLGLIKQLGNIEKSLFSLSKNLPGFHSCGISSFPEANPGRKEEELRRSWKWCREVKFAVIILCHRVLWMGSWISWLGFTS